ncbi:hypothetical protein, partial [Helicobacter pylori]|uniref:hypothetical protein n=1 Tax=Helicobacter pylori TaxID=210 RepID=UPI001EE3E7ED
RQMWCSIARDYFMFNATATTNIYTALIVGIGGCVEETASTIDGETKSWKGSASNPQSSCVACSAASRSA